MTISSMCAAPPPTRRFYGPRQAFKRQIAISVKNRRGWGGETALCCNATAESSSLVAGARQQQQRAQQHQQAVIILAEGQRPGFAGDKAHNGGAEESAQ